MTYVTSGTGPDSVFSNVPVFALNCRTVCPPSSPVYTVPSEASTVTQVMGCECPTSFMRHSPVSRFHFLTVLSPEPVKRAPSSWNTAMDVTIMVWPRKVAIGEEVAMFHLTMVPSAEPLSNASSRSWVARHVTIMEWPLIVAISSNLMRSHFRTVQSVEPLKITPSPESSTKHVTGPVWPLKACSWRPVTQFITLMSAPSARQNKRPPSALHCGRRSISPVS
mmetsp:Transcript_86962/g.266227  ORF Transcript_86962/g.266227 Transcript_86962/m.266227 type:complete len:222 (-) Transcript_86962:203-868(-)